MKDSKQLRSASRAIESKPKASNQASVKDILQAYKRNTIQKAEIEEDELLQGKFDTFQREGIPKEEDEFPIQQKSVNKTGLPDNLKSGVENLSGYSLDDVKVHYNSDKPAQLNALAYAQGADIHVSPGQEKHLPHEAWHVVQQKQGRVQPTIQMQGVNVNDNEGLEKEADMMGEMSNKITLQYQVKTNNLYRKRPTLNVSQLRRITLKSGEIINTEEKTEDELEDMIPSLMVPGTLSILENLIEAIEQGEFLSLSIPTSDISSSTDLSEEEEMSEGPIMQHLNEKKLYRSVHEDELKNLRSSKGFLAKNNFFSPSRDYASQYIGGTKAKGSSYCAFIQFNMDDRIFNIYSNFLTHGLAHFQNAGKAKELFKKQKTKNTKQTKYILKLEGDALNIQIKEGCNPEELNGHLSSHNELQ